MKVYLSIDPGLVGTGVAVWDADTWGECVSPIATFIAKPAPSIKDWTVKCPSIIENMKMKLRVLGIKPEDVEGVFSEIPKDFDSVIGQAAAKTGSIVKLATFVGYLLCTFHSWGIPVIFIDVNDHLGQLPKELVQKRIDRLFPELEVSSHGYDAVSVGLFAKGFRLNGEKR